MKKFRNFPLRNNIEFQYLRTDIKKKKNNANQQIPIIMMALTSQHTHHSS